MSVTKITPVCLGKIVDKIKATYLVVHMDAKTRHFSIIDVGIDDIAIGRLLDACFKVADRDEMLTELRRTGKTSFGDDEGRSITIYRFEN